MTQLSPTELSQSSPRAPPAGLLLSLRDRLPCPVCETDDCDSMTGTAGNGTAQWPRVLAGTAVARQLCRPLYCTDGDNPRMKEVSLGSVLLSVRVGSCSGHGCCSFGLSAPSGSACSG